jgi:hypothetical protein
LVTLPSEKISWRFFKGRETLRGQNTAVISDEYERVKLANITIPYVNSINFTKLSMVAIPQKGM